MPHKRDLIQSLCQECGCNFIGIDYGGGQRTKTCSGVCLKKAMKRHLANLPRKGKENASWKGGKPEWECKNCGLKFKAYQKKNGTERMYCSWVCANTANRETVWDMKSRIQFERILMKLLEGKGYQCIRSAGSRGPADIYAISNEHIRVIQVKTTKDMDRPGNLSVFTAAVESLRLVPRPPNLKRELWVKPLRKEWIFIDVDELPVEHLELRKSFKTAEWKLVV